MKGIKLAPVRIRADDATPSSAIESQADNNASNRRALLKLVSVA